MFITLNSSCATKFLFTFHLWWEKMGKSCHHFRRFPYFWASLTIERIAQSICCDTWHKIIASTIWRLFLSLQVFLECTVNDHFVIHPSSFNKFLLFCLIEHQFSCIIPYGQGLFECSRKWPYKFEVIINVNFLNMLLSPSKSLISVQISSKGKRIFTLNRAKEEKDSWDSTNSYCS